MCVPRNIWDTRKKVVCCLCEVQLNPSYLAVQAQEEGGGRPTAGADSPRDRSRTLRVKPLCSGHGGLEQMKWVEKGKKRRFLPPLQATGVYSHPMTTSCPRTQSRRQCLGTAPGHRPGAQTWTAVPGPSRTFCDQRTGERPILQVYPSRKGFNVLGA